MVVNKLLIKCDGDSACKGAEIHCPLTDYTTIVTNGTVKCSVIINGPNKNSIIPPRIKILTGYHFMDLQCIDNMIWNNQSINMSYQQAENSIIQSPFIPSCQGIVIACGGSVYDSSCQLEWNLNNKSYAGK